ncbi:unnamed protein product, partial [marine sediment metagenome]
MADIKEVYEKIPKDVFYAFFVPKAPLEHLIYAINKNFIPDLTDQQWYTLLSREVSQFMRPSLQEYLEKHTNEENKNLTNKSYFVKSLTRNDGVTAESVYFLEEVKYPKKPTNPIYRKSETDYRIIELIQRSIKKDDLDLILYFLNLRDWHRTFLPEIIESAYIKGKKEIAQKLKNLWTEQRKNILEGKNNPKEKLKFVLEENKYGYPEV